MIAMQPRACLCLAMDLTPGELEAEARKALREVLAYASANLYRTNGSAWRQIVASLAFETSADLSLIRDFDEQDQARFEVITKAFACRQLEVGDIIALYLEFFPRPADFRLGEGPDGGG